MTPSDAKFYIGIAFLVGNVSGLMLAFIIMLFSVSSTMKK